jgi:tRNA pseudouridine38-40 synthase
LRNIRLTIEFCGAGFAGWQYQPDRPTVQGAVETAIEKVTRQAVRVHGCSRTDAGVSARAFVANCHLDTALAPEKLRLALNAHLPDTVHVREAAEADEKFQARFSAKGKRYEYTVVLGISPLRRGRAWEYRYPVDARLCRPALALFQGTHDFQPFCQFGLGTRSETEDGVGRRPPASRTVMSRANGVCTVRRVTLEAAGDELVFAVEGDRFLYKMVRRIVGALVAVGAGRLEPGDITAALEGKPHKPFQTAPACGLVLDRVEY